MQVLLAGDQLSLFDAPDGPATGIPDDAVGVMGLRELDDADLLTDEAFAAIG